MCSERLDVKSFANQNSQNNTAEQSSTLAGRKLTFASIVVDAYLHQSAFARRTQGNTSGDMVIGELSGATHLCINSEIASHDQGNIEKYPSRRVFSVCHLCQFHCVFGLEFLARDDVQRVGLGYVADTKCLRSTRHISFLKFTSVEVTDHLCECLGINQGRHLGTAQV